MPDLVSDLSLFIGFFFLLGELKARHLGKWSKNYDYDRELLHILHDIDSIDCIAIFNYELLINAF